MLGRTDCAEAWRLLFLATSLHIAAANTNIVVLW